MVHFVHRTNFAEVLGRVLASKAWRKAESKARRKVGSKVASKVASKAESKQKSNTTKQIPQIVNRTRSKANVSLRDGRDTDAKKSIKGVMKGGSIRGTGTHMSAKMPLGQRRSNWPLGLR